MSNQNSVLLIGWHPDVTDYSKWPELTKEKLNMALDEARHTLISEGYEARWCFINSVETARETVSEELMKEEYNCVLIGAGVRLDPEAFLIFEELINVIHDFAPSCKICFNTNLSDIAESVKRWVTLT